MKNLRWLFLIFLVAGFALFAGGFYAARDTSAFLDKAETATGVVVENVRQWRSGSRNHRSSGTYHPRIQFRTSRGEMVEFVSSVGSRPASYRVNESVEVVYDPERPHEAVVNGFWSVWILPIVLFVLGGAFAIAGGAPLFVMRRNAQTREWLRANGRRIETSIERVELNRSVRVNGSHPYRIISQWLNPATNRIHVFKSRNIWYDPSSHLGGNTVQVLIDPDNPKRYFMETEFLPKMAE